MNKHTKGPWAAHEYGSPLGSFYVRGPNKEMIVSGPTLKSEANARLIAAAPDLLEALAKLLKAEKLDDDDSHLTEARESARAAIAKARGEK